MRRKTIAESEMFLKINVMLTNDLKQKMEYEKERATLYSDVEVDNSTLFRAMIAYLYDHEEVLKKLKPYIQQTKGQHLLESLEQMMEDNTDKQKIQDQLGIGLDIINKIEKKRRVLPK